MGDARKGREICETRGRAGANEADWLGAGKGGGKLDSLQLLHVFDVREGDGHLL